MLILKQPAVQRIYLRLEDDSGYEKKRKNLLLGFGIVRIISNAHNSHGLSYSYDCRTSISTKRYGKRKHMFAIWPCQEF